MKYKGEDPYCEDCWYELFGSAESDLTLGPDIPVPEYLPVSRDGEGGDGGDSGDSGDYGEDYDEWDDEDDDWDEEEDGICSEDFKQILDVLLESEFVLSNLATVMGKILEFFLNKGTEEFCEKADKVLQEIMKIWGEVTEIVPPLDCLLQKLFEIPNDGDKCTNCAVNNALPLIWTITQQYVTPACDSVADIAKECNNATSIQYCQDAMNILSSNVSVA